MRTDFRLTIRENWSTEDELGNQSPPHGKRHNCRIIKSKDVELYGLIQHADDDQYMLFPAPIDYTIVIQDRIEGRGGRFLFAWTLDGIQERFAELEAGAAYRNVFFVHRMHT